MDAFAEALKVVLVHEGGYSNDPADAGGPTNLGLTLDDWRSFYGKSGTLDDIKSLTPEVAGEIYKKLYWVPMGLDQIGSVFLAVVLFDQGVLSGSVGAISRLQTVLGVSIDGEIGPETLGAIKRTDDKKLAFDFLRVCLHHYLAIVEKNKSQLVFIDGWCDRVMSLIDYICFADAT